MPKNSFIVEFGRIDIDLQEEILPYYDRVWNNLKRYYIQMIFPFLFIVTMPIIFDAKKLNLSTYFSIICFFFLFFFVFLGGLQLLYALYQERYAIIALSIKNNTFSVTYDNKSQIHTYEVTPFSEVEVEFKYSYKRGNHHPYIVISHPLWGFIKQHPSPSWTIKKIEKLQNALQNANRYYKMANPK